MVKEKVSVRTQRLPLIGCHVDDALRIPYNADLPIDALCQYAVARVRDNN